MFAHFKTKEKIIANGLFLFFAIGAYAGVYWGVEKYKKDALDLQSSVKSVEANEVLFIATKNAYLNTESERMLVDGFVLRADEVVMFLERLESLAQTVGVEMETDSVSTAVYGDKGSAWETFVVNFSTEGSWTLTYRFLSLLEHLPYLSKLTQVTVEKSLTGEESFWRGTFRLEVLKRKSS